MYTFGTLLVHFELILYWFVHFLYTVIAFLTKLYCIGIVSVQPVQKLYQKCTSDVARLEHLCPYFFMLLSSCASRVHEMFNNSVHAFIM